VLEILTGSGLAAASGLNAYIPLLALGLLGRFTDIITLPAGWAWLENGWVLIIVGVLLVVEIVADKIPAVDHVNDILQTVVRPASGGIVFGSGTSAETPAITDPGGFFASGSWIPVAIGIALAFVVHLGKAGTRAVANVGTAGVAAPVLSTAEDASSVVLTVLALLVPVFAAIGVVALGVALVLIIRRGRRAMRNRRPMRRGAVAT
jgi:hypothetical protein